MPTKHQHFVPRVYLKSWETTVETIKEPNKKFQGVYCFKNNSKIGDGANKESILWQPHLYTIDFTQLYISPKCPNVYNFFVDQVFDVMKNASPFPVYGKLGYSEIKTKKSIHKHLMEIDNWQFLYADGTQARTKSILNKINDLKCYILEEEFSKCFENKWEHTKDTFINSVKNGLPKQVGESERIISQNSALDILEFFYMMLCRNPHFNPLGLYTWLKNDILAATKIPLEEADMMMESIWYTELYRIFFKKKGGYFHTIFDQSLEKCQMILFETYDDAGFFITSDNPAFEHKSCVESINSNGFYFPLSPKYLLFICKGNSGINIVDHRFADKKTVQKFNQIMKSHHFETIISNTKILNF